MKTRLYRLFIAAFGFVLGLLGNVVASGLTGAPMSTILPISLGLLIAAGLLFYGYRKFRPNLLTVAFKAPITLRAESDKANYQRKGVIVFLSIYSPRDRSNLRQQIPAVWQAIDTNDPSLLDFEQSNFAPVVTAITSHRDTLQHCWVISTLPDPAAPPDRSTLPNGSAPFVPLLIAHLTRHYNLQCQFHTGPEYHMPVLEDALKPEKTRIMVQGIYEQLASLGLTNRDLVADITSCPRDMALGMILACLQSNGDVQFIGTDYENGTPRPCTLAPYVFPFETRIND